MLSKKTLKLNRGYLDAEDDEYDGGYFFTYDPKTLYPNNIASCREEFFGSFGKNTKWIGFITPVLNIKLLNKFFTKIENQLKIKKQTVFYHSNLKGAVIIEVADFWLENQCRRSLFTLLLRCGAVYFKNDFDKAINSYNLAKATKNAIHYFLAGNVNPTFTDIEGGFYSKFQSLKGNNLARLLRGKPLTKLAGSITMYPLMLD